MKTNEIMLMDHIELLYEYPVVLFGAGAEGGRTAEILEETQMQFYGFADSDILKWGTEKSGRPVCSPLQLKEKCQKEKVVVLISVGIPHIDSVLAVIEHLEIRPYVLATMYALEYALHAHYNCSRFPAGFAEKQAMLHKIYEGQRNVDTQYFMQKTILNVNVMLTGKSPILVYQSGKVGSMSIAQSLGRLGMPAVHVHYMSAGDQTIILDKVTTPVKIITGVRNPINRWISYFFYGIRFGRPIPLARVKKFDDLLERDVTEAFLIFLKEYMRSIDEFEWYDNELKKYCGIDVYEYPFDKEKGYTIIEKGNIKVFLYKMECLDKLEGELRDFVGNQELVIQHDNAIQDSPGKYAYREFKEAVKFPAEIFWEYYNSEKMRHFYTDEEAEKMRSDWIDRLI